MVLLLALLLSIAPSCCLIKPNKSQYSYADTTITLPSVVDTLVLEVHDTTFITKDSTIIVIQRDTLAKTRVIYRRPEVKLVLDSVLKYKTILIKEVKRIHHQSCDSGFHRFCVGFFILSMVTLLVRIIINALI